MSTAFKLRVKRFSVALLVPLLVVFYPAAAMADGDTSTNGTTPTTQTTQNTGPTKPNGADASTYHYNADTGKWENDYYIWDPVTHQTTPKTASNYTYDLTSGTWNTTDWQYDAPSGTYKAVPKPVPSSVVDNSNNQNVNTTVSQDAQTGDASVTRNTTGGSATTGSANDIANVINILQSSLTASGNSGNVMTFNTSIPGDVTGNLYIDPGTIMQNQSGPNASGNVLQSGGGIQVNNANNGQINNAILLNATSGNAAVVGNTSAGSATSGDANAVVNLVNFMNSSVSAGQSFIGAINVQGDLSGDILLPDGLLDRILAANNAVNSSNQDSTTNNTNNQTITNDVNVNAQSGSANVSDNTSAGSATTGSAKNMLTVLNMTGSNIIGSNALLVFVNVMGTWTGLIVNAPGSNSALLGGGITSTDAVASNGFSNVNNTNDMGIHNTITANATTGSADVSHNTTAGDATSGNATTSVNLANILNSNIALSHWFGILFINVMGNWNGSFGFGSPKSQTAGSSSTGSTSGNQVFTFEATARNQSSGSSNTNNQDFQANNQVASVAPTAIVAHGPSKVLGQATTNAAGAVKDHSSLMIPVAGFALGLLILGADKLFLNRRS